MVTIFQTKGPGKKIAGFVDGFATLPSGIRRVQDLPQALRQFRRKFRQQGRLDQPDGDQVLDVNLIFPSIGH